MPLDPAVPPIPPAGFTDRWQLLLESAPEGYWALDRAAGTIWISAKSAAQMHPRSLEAATSENGGWRLPLSEIERLAIIPADDLDRLRTAIGHHTGELRQEFRILGPSGDYRWVVARAQNAHPGPICGWLSPLRHGDQAEELLRAVIDTVSPLTGKQYFERLAVRLSEALHMRYCLISELLPGTPERVRSIAYAIDGVVTSDVEYALVGTPCEEVVAKGLCVYPTGVQALFPADTALAEMSVDSYLGIALRSSTGETMGLLSVLGSEPLRADDYAAALFEHFAGRASAELDRLRLDRQRLASQRQYRQLFENMPAGFAVLNAEPSPDGGLPVLRWVECNPVMESMLRMPVADVLGRTLLEVLPHFDRGAYALLQHVLATGEEHHAIPYSTRYGATLELAAFRAAPGQLAVLAQDLTQRLAAESALRESERRFRELLETVNLAAIILDWDGRIVFCNESLARVLGYERAELHGMDWCRNFLVQEERETVSARLRSLFAQSDAPRTGRNFVLTRDGRRRLFEWDNTPLLDAHSAPTGIAAIGRDLTDWMALEEQVRHAQKMEAVGRLAGGVAHDFNNLLTVISGYTRLALGQLPTGDSVLPRYLHEVVKAADRAAERTRQLLAFGRRQVLQARPVGVHALLKSIERVLAEVAGERVSLVLDFHAVHDVTVADPGQVEQVLLNLAVNAREAMPEGGRLVIATRNERVGPPEPGTLSKLGPGDYILIAVSDSGRGMDQEVLAHLFEPFYSTKGLGEGSGLGLSMAYGIVGQSGGDIHVTSELGRGTCFEIYLPCAKPESDETPQPEPAEAAPISGGGESILIAEDQEEVLAFASEVLLALGYRVTRACDANDAVQKARELDWKVDLLLTDLMMPGADGGTLARELCAAIPGLKVIFMSGYSDPGGNGSPLREDGGRYIRKPFSPQQLSAIVRAELGTGARKVLVADDEEAVRVYIRSILEDAGYAVREAADGREAMRELEREPVDVLVTDLVMPDQEGIETIRLARKAFADLRIIAISGAFYGQFLKMAELLGANAVLAKPLTQASLLDAVRDVLERPPD